MSVPTSDSTLCISENSKQLEISTIRDWLNKSPQMYEVNLISTGFPRVAVIEGGFHFIFYLHAMLSNYFSSNL